MTTLEILQNAIANRTPVSFEYTREGKQPGQRYGHPHAVFIRRLKSEEEKVYLHRWQLDGVTDSGKELPDWRQFFLNDVHDVNPDSAAQPFDIADGYNPDYYEFPIARV